jgi:hypothetical protein
MTTALNLTCYVRRAEAALEVLEAETAARGEAAAATRGAAMGAINKRNAAANFDNAFRNVGARPGGQAGAKPGTAGVAEGEDVFQRRKTRVVNYWDVSKTGGAGGARPPNVFTGGVIFYVRLHLYPRNLLDI